jgi:hypothetical protein
VILRKLKRNPIYEPCQVEDDDELYPNGIFIFNITKMQDYIRNNPLNFKIENILVDHYHQNSNLDQSYVMQTDISKPGIIAEIAPGRFNLIDGNHRIEKARSLGREYFEFYKFMMESHLPFLTTKEGYLAYVDYWNSKL